MSRQRREDVYVEVGEVEVLRETAKCWIFKFIDGFGAVDAGKERLVPKSQVNPNYQPAIGEAFQLEVTDWYAKILEEPEQERPHVDVPDVVVMCETAKALQIRVGQREALVWVPVYAVHKDSPVRHDGDPKGVLRILESMAIEKGIAPGPAGGLTAGADARKAPSQSSDPDDGMPF